MKPLCTAIAAIVAMVFFTQCKKNNTPQQPERKKITPGYYIIRTKYMCSDGRAFVLGSFSNHEFMGWQKASPEELKAIKEDGPPASNNLVWQVGESISHGAAIEGLPSPAYNDGNIRYAFSIYQDEGNDPNNPRRWYISTPGESNNPEDLTGYGIGPSIPATHGVFSEEDLRTMTISMTYIWATDSTGRLAAYGKPHWWYISLPTDPDDVCDDYRNAVIWRNSTLCPNTTVVGGGEWWKVDRCAISQLVLEKIE